MKLIYNINNKSNYNHPEGIKGVQKNPFIKSSFKKDKSKKKLNNCIEDNFEYDLNRTVEELRETYEYNKTIQNAFSIGGDSDSLEVITGGIAEAYY